MILKLKGCVDEVCSKYFVLNVNNIFYEIFSEKGFLSTLKELKHITVFTHYSIKETTRELYGFETKEDRDFFKFMIGIRGIGEKTMLNWLSNVSSSRLKEILYDEDLEELCKLPKVGRRTGEKIITDIRHKIKSWDVSGLKKAHFNQDVINNSVSALISLGVTPSNAKERTKELYNTGMNVSELVNLVLKK